MSIRVEIIDPSRARDLRRRVLRPHLPPDAPLPGDDTPDAVTFGAVDDADDRVLCTCFVYPDPCPWAPGRPAWHLRQMATEPDRQGQGLGAMVVRSAVAHVTDRGAHVLWFNARESAIGFYRRLGFLTRGEVFTDDQHTIPHIRMWRELFADPDASHLTGGAHA